MRYVLLFLVASGAVLFSGRTTAASAQQTAFDSTLGKYRVEYRSGRSGRMVAALVEAPNKIEPTFRLVSVQEIDGEFLYAYSVANGTGSASQQAIVRFDFDCPEREFLTVQEPAEWEVNVGEEGFGPRYTCDVSDLKQNDPDLPAGIQPGQTLEGLEVRTSMLPGVGVAYFWGDAERVRWPESVETLEDPRVFDAVDELSGITGGWVERMVIVPDRDPSESSAGQIVHALGEDLTQTCNDRQWITQGLCRSYQAALREVATALGEERLTDARAEADDLLRQIERDWRRAPRQLEPDAYWLLRTNLEAVRADLDDILSTVTGEGPQGFDGENHSAAIHVHPAGRWLYVSNRGDFDSIAVFAIDPRTGLLTPGGHQRDGIAWPRSFALHPDGRWLLVANRHMGEVRVFAVDPATGALTPTGERAAVPDPTHVLLAPRAAGDAP